MVIVTFKYAEKVERANPPPLPIPTPVNIDETAALSIL